VGLAYMQLKSKAMMQAQSDGFDSYTCIDFH